MQSRLFSKEPREILKATKAITEGLGWEIKEEKPSEITIRTPASIRSWGETIRMEVRQVRDNTEVTVSSSPDYQLFDWGKSSENETLILDGLRKKLA